MIMSFVFPVEDKIIGMIKPSQFFGGEK